VSLRTELLGEDEKTQEKNERSHRVKPSGKVKGPLEATDSDFKASARGAKLMGPEAEDYDADNDEPVPDAKGSHQSVPRNSMHNAGSRNSEPCNEIPISGFEYLRGEIWATALNLCHRGFRLLKARLELEFMTLGKALRVGRSLSPNVRVQRPRADVSARGRARRNVAHYGSPARGRALYGWAVRCNDLLGDGPKASKTCFEQWTSSLAPL
jgi:hypothetical protein